MEIDDLETPTEQSSSTAQNKCSSEFDYEKDSNKKLTSPKSLEDSLSQDPLITLQSSVFEINVNLLDFLNLYNKIGTAKDNL
ncbi:hypothetical protein C1646_773697 [Rhizophagus diaphanus]|nr:hypothetical protein C1646_773697 [Rhizophagus diaphanus] [Rhizophagus sp. MUCL 43196]